MRDLNSEKRYKLINEIWKQGLQQITIMLLLASLPSIVYLVKAVFSK